MKTSVLCRTGAMKQLLVLFLLCASVLAGCAKEECYECNPPGNIPGQQSVEVCGKGQDLDVSLSYYTSQGYDCSKTSDRKTVAGPDIERDLTLLQEEE